MISPGDAVGVFAAGLAAGTINTIVGSGSLVTFPTLLAVGYAPVLANVSNTVGLVPGNVSGSIGYREELSGQRSRIVRLGLASLAGGAAGAALLLVLPQSVFRSVVPALILLACVLVVAQPRVAGWLAAREATGGHGGPLLLAGTLLSGVYGGYFGAAQGVVILALTGMFVDEDLQRLNAAKNVLVAVVNGIAALVFVAFTHVAWEAAGLVAAGSILGGQVGARIGRRLPPGVLRALIVVVGVTAAIVLLV